MTKKKEVTVGYISNKLGVTKPSVYYHLKKMKIKTKELPVSSNHKETVINGADALKLLANLKSQDNAKNFVEMRTVAKQLKVHYVSLLYWVKKLGIPMKKRRVKNKHAVNVISRAAANKIRQAIR